MFFVVATIFSRKGAKPQKKLKNLAYFAALPQLFLGCVSHNHKFCQNQGFSMLKGLLLKESLNDLRVIDGLRITKTEILQAGNAAPNQPPVWTALSFEADDSQADALAAKLSQAIKPEGWYINASTDIWVYVVFPGKVFKYARGNAEQRAAAKQYGRSCNIPEKQLDWSE